MSTFHRYALMLCTVVTGAAFAQDAASPARIEVTAPRLVPAELYCCGVDPAQAERAAFGLTRAQVHADMLAARAAAVGEDQPLAFGPSTTTRERVLAELGAARASGAYQRLNGEGWDRPSVVAQAPAAVVIADRR